MKAMKTMKKKSSLPRAFRIFTAAAMILAAGVPSTSAYASGGRKAEAPAPLVMPPSGSVPVIDGRLDDAIWSSASRFDAFKTFKPDYGKEPSQRTEAYLAYDPDNVYFAFRCEDTEPAKIKSSVCKRDAMGQDDMVGLILDTFNDNQSGFTFMLNPLGIQGDGIMDVQGNVDDSHDTVWYSKGLIDDGGWTVEARVPLQSLRFPAGKSLMMKCLFFRFQTRTSEQFSFPPLDPDNSNLMAQAQPLQVSGLHHKRVIEFLPAFTYGSRHEASGGKFRRTEENSDISLTGKIGLTSDLTLDGAYNPDFSQVEADAGQVDINLRYALYYQEKRPFFLEGQDIWQVRRGDGRRPAVIGRLHADHRRPGLRLPADRKARPSRIRSPPSTPGTSSRATPWTSILDFTIARYKHTLSRRCLYRRLLYRPGIRPGIQPRRRLRRPVPA